MAALDVAADVADIFGPDSELPKLSGTYAQGNKTKAGEAVRHTRARQRDGAAGLEPEACRLLFPATFFASGFTGGGVVLPSAGDTFTAGSEALWTVDRVELRGLETYYALTCSRRVKKGAG